MARDHESIAPLLTILSFVFENDEIILQWGRHEDGGGYNAQAVQEFGRARVNGGQLPGLSIDCSSVPLRRLHAS